jgi:hypothetical protein
VYTIRCIKKNGKRIQNERTLICLPDEVDGVVDDVAVEGVAVDALLAQLSCTSYINISSFFLHRRFLSDGVKDFQENINLFF